MEIILSYYTTKYVRNCIKESHLSADLAFVINFRLFTYSGFHLHCDWLCCISLLHLNLTTLVLKECHMKVAQCTRVIVVINLWCNGFLYLLSLLVHLAFISRRCLKAYAQDPRVHHIGFPLELFYVYERQQKFLTLFQVVNTFHSVLVQSVRDLLR